MPIDLNQPSEGDVGWAGDVNQNFTDIETRLNALGSMADQDASNVSITGGSIAGTTDLAITDGGTGASSVAAAQANLQVPPTSRTISTTSPLSGGGDLSADRTLTLGTVPESKGGTNQTTYASGDILYASAADTLNKLAAGSDGDVLTIDSGVPTWAPPSGGADYTANAALNALASLTPAADQLPYFTSGTTAALTTLTTWARDFLDGTSAADALSLLGLGTAAVYDFEDFQPNDAQLTALAALSYTGNAGKVVAVNATGDGFELVSASGGGFTEVKQQVFTSSGTYTPTSGMVCGIAVVTGAGGGGGGADMSSGGIGCQAGGGGGAGATVIRLFTAADIGTSKSVTIGSGGIAGANSGGSGGSGGSATFLSTATGGSGGSGAVAAGGTNASGAGGSGASASSTSALLGANGGEGASGFVTSGPGSPHGGHGGASYWGGGGKGGIRNNILGAGSVAGSAADAFGAGGGGAGSYNTTSGAAGGAGKSGVVVIWEFIA